MKKIFLTLLLAIFLLPGKAIASGFTVSNVSYNVTTGATSFDYTGASINLSYTNGTLGVYDSNNSDWVYARSGATISDYCTSSHCNITAGGGFGAPPTNGDTVYVCIYDGSGASACNTNATVQSQNFTWGTAPFGASTPLFPVDPTLTGNMAAGMQGVGDGIIDEMVKMMPIALAVVVSIVAITFGLRFFRKIAFNEDTPIGGVDVPISQAIENGWAVSDEYKEGFMDAKREDLEIMGGEED